jgi:hypothetical protein
MPLANDGFKGSHHQRATPFLQSALISAKLEKWKERTRVTEIILLQNRWKNKRKANFWTAVRTTSRFSAVAKVESLISPSSLESVA